MSKTFAVLSVVLASLFCCFEKAAAADMKPGAVIYVSTQGNDAWSGALAAPNAAKNDGPLATLVCAKEKIRAMKKSGPLPAGGVAVVLRQGIYCLPRTLQLEKQDSGTAESPVVYAAAPGETVQVIGGRTIANFTPYRGAILKADVASQGLKGVYFRQLFFDGRRQHLARYPNFDPQNPYGGGWAYADGKPIPMYQNIPGESKRTVHYREKDARTWARPEELEVFVFPRYNWWNNIVRVASIDRAKREITLAGDASYPIRPSDRYYIQNALEELDAPGEWYLDRRTNTLYFWPPAPLAGKTVYAPTLRTLIQVGKGASHIQFRRITFECCEGDALRFDAADDCLVGGCVIRNAGDYHGSGVVVSGGHRNGVVGNDIYEIGSNAVVLGGGDRVTLTPADNYADNNYIHHVGVFYKQGVGVQLNGVGNRATHNLIHDCPRFGIGFSGNNLLIEYNHIRHADLETADTGAVYTGGRDWISSRGTVIRYNYFHDILGFGQENGRWCSPHYAWGVYLDDNTGGVDVVGNIIARCVRGLVHLHNGRDNHIENNILIDGTLQQFEANGWTEKSQMWKDHFPTMVKGYTSVAGQEAWKSMRNMDLPPDKAVLPNGMIMSGNEVLRNIFYYSKPEAKLFRVSNFPLDHNVTDYNLAYHFGKPIAIDYGPKPKPAKPAKATKGKKPTKPAADPHDTPADRWPAWWQAAGHDRHSIVADPMFVDPSKDDYRLKPDSPALKLGFKPIPVEKIGPYADPMRASWPIVEAEGVREKPLVSPAGAQ